MNRSAIFAVMGVAIFALLVVSQVSTGDGGGEPALLSSFKKLFKVFQPSPPQSPPQPPSFPLNGIYNWCTNLKPEVRPDDPSVGGGVAIVSLVSLDDLGLILSSPNTRVSVNRNPPAGAAFGTTFTYNLGPNAVGTGVMNVYLEKAGGALPSTTNTEVEYPLTEYVCGTILLSPTGEALGYSLFPIPSGNPVNLAHTDYISSVTKGKVEIPVIIKRLAGPNPPELKADQGPLIRPPHK